MFAIKVTPKYYPGVVNPVAEHSMTISEAEEDSNSQEIAEFESESVAEEVIDQILDDEYYLADGESGRPDYEVVDLSSG